MDIFQQLANGLSEIASIGVVIACVVLWMRRRSNWVLIALIGELGSLACRLALIMSPTLFTEWQFLRVLWPLNACIFAIGLLGYAWFESSDRTAVAIPEVQP
jgi:hypothetical protein